MNTQFLAQPDVQLGLIISELLDSDPAPRRVIFVSAFVGLQTVMRFKRSIEDIISGGSFVWLVLGIDMGGTSQEVLKEVCSWGSETKVIKHRVPGHTFHPKLYLFEWHDRAEIIIGSNNLTEGGFFRNYEGGVRVRYDFLVDEALYKTAQGELGRFLEPDGPTSYILTERFLQELIDRNEIPTEAEARSFQNRSGKGSTRRTTEEKTKGSLFGVEDFPTPPPLPANLLKDLLRDVDRRRRERRRASQKARQPSSETTPISANSEGLITAAAFYMTLPKLQGKSIPGEARIPLEAIELAQEFWGWPDEYARAESPRSGKRRVYWNWRPRWKVWSVENTTELSIQPVRMYMYENSSDFRFYVRPLVNAGADLGDVVRIRRIAEAEAEYECVLARKGTGEYDDWIDNCTQSVRNSTRCFGYA